MRTIIIIPARYSSSRFPGKVLAGICGKPLIQHIFEQAKKVCLAEDIIVATDDKRISDEVSSFGGKSVFTSPDHKTGSDRIAEVAEKEKCDIIINLQGDEILVYPDMVNELISLFLEDKTLEMGTIKRKIVKREDIYNHNIVKVVTDKQGYALYFSRSPIPFMRDINSYDLSQQKYYQHIGIYGYKRDFILKFNSLPLSFLEEAEKLEQLRALENGYKIKVIETKGESLRIDVPEDLIIAEELMGSILNK
ncbi:MAG: 3-deoxy-manno-octulosonate cytidylyltransferase [Nitrospirota bacterium]